VPSDEEGVGIIAASSMASSKIGVDQVLLSLVRILNMVCQGGRQWRKGSFSAWEDPFTWFETMRRPRPGGRPVEGMFIANGGPMEFILHASMGNTADNEHGNVSRRRAALHQQCWCCQLGWGAITDQRYADTHSAANRLERADNWRRLVAWNLRYWRYAGNNG
jgi:hypothetical protein